MAVLILNREKFLVQSELRQRLFHVLAELHVQQARKFRKALREPLIVVTLPADPLSPPLMRTLMAAEEVRKLGLILDP